MISGTKINDWAAVDGAYYADKRGEAIRLATSIILCIATVVIAARHQMRTYKKM